jgi:LCP family protein required for cell wall assembly
MHEHESVDFLKPQREFSPQNEPVSHEPTHKKPRYGLRLSLFALAISVLGVGIFSYGIAHTSPSEIEGGRSFFTSLRHLVGANDRSTDAAADDRINVLLLGIGGAGHAGAELTDTMILGSFKPSTGEVGMISIPRDLTLLVQGHGYTKINAVNAYAEQDAPGSGIEAITETVESIMDETIDYTVKVDFSSFSEIIDAIGGIDVYVETAFTDYQYPIHGMEDAVCTSATPTTEESNDESEEPSSPSTQSGYGCRYEVLSFTEGITHMNGESALKYARSRKGNNGEGSDFARAARQQKVLLAWKEKALSLGVLLNPGKLQNIVDVVRNNVTTNMTVWDMMSLAKYADKVKTDAIASHVIDASSGLVYNSYLGNAYVLWPRKEDWSEFKQLADNIFSSSGSSTTLSTAPQSAPLPSVTVEIQNGTKQVGLASQTAQLLQSSGYGISAIGNATNTNWTTTTIFDFTGGKKDKELAALKDYLNADIVMTSAGALVAKEIAPDAIWEATSIESYRTETSADFVVILGENSGTLVMSSSYVR